MQGGFLFNKKRLETPRRNAKGWLLQKVLDKKDDHETCMMCGQEDIRFAHVLAHPDLHRFFRVGERCAGAMTEACHYPEKKPGTLHRISTCARHYFNE